MYDRRRQRDKHIEGEPCTAVTVGVRVPKRTTIEIDEALLARAKRPLGHTTTWATVEDALRRAADRAEREHAERAARQARFFDRLDARVDVSVLLSEEMWR
ncbi:MAG TPA: type II toxin-antitoxin system VapB family antitoxin [Acidimicrobiales bacterium]|jgi:Arc/MetJ family transcription regulator|nr:type II toxin-antitoxin system VapB family antitoxin [Acidimicrobiales bacterium]